MARDDWWYWEEQRRKARAFEDAAEAAKRELFPEVYFSDHEPSITVCRLCERDGYHAPNCKLRNPDGKERATVDDLLKYAPDKPKEEKTLIEIERERQARLAGEEPGKKKPEEEPSQEEAPLDSNA